MWIKEIIIKLRRQWRQWRVLRLVKSHCGEVYVSGGSYNTSLSSKTELGINPNFNGMTIKGNGRVVFGDNFHSGEGCLILTSNHNYNGTKLPYDETNIDREVIIGNNVWFGDRVIVMGGVTIGDGCIIQAGAVVVNNIPDLGIAGGNPAKVFKYRDKEHYNSLLIKRLFH